MCYVTCWLWTLTFPSNRIHDVSNSSLKTFLHIFPIFPTEVWYFLKDWLLHWLVFSFSFVDCSFFLLPSRCACLQILRANRQLVRVCFTVECMYLQGVNESTLTMTPDILVSLIRVLCTLFHGLSAQRHPWYDLICVCLRANGYVLPVSSEEWKRGMETLQQLYIVQDKNTIVKLGWQAAEQTVYLISSCSSYG